MSTSSEAALKEEIARLSGAISRHKTNNMHAGRGNAYINPNYRPPSKPAFHSSYAKYQQGAAGTSGRPVDQPREVVIDGVAFQSSNRSLVRKDLTKPSSGPPPPFKQQRTHPQGYAKKLRHPVTRAAQRSYKAKASHRFSRKRNMTLDNRTGSTRAGRRNKYVDKQCPRFSTTGVCNKGRTCFYKHDPAKIAICWQFLYGSCSNTAESCSLSHDPTPERTPLCVHFANNGRCKNGDRCLYPHVRVGLREGVCRDFAVLGYCDTGIDCERQHVRECPDFADKGICPNPRCKLPHVIRANRRRAGIAKATSTTDSTSPTVPAKATEQEPGDSEMTYGNDAKIGDEYISLTFHESEESDEGGDDDSEGDDSQEDDDSNGDENEESNEDSMEVHA